KAAAAAVHAKPNRTFANALNGFAGPLDAGQLIALRKNPNVVAIEADQLLTTTATQHMDSSGDPWGLDRIDERSLPLDKRYSYDVQGQGVYVYVLDTGIDLNHPDLNGAKAVFDAFGGNGRDCHGHGTHVAGIIGGKVHGVAKQARLRS